MGFLSGVRVIDVTRGLAGPFATHIMADYDADIIRVDQPGAERTPAERVHLRGRRSIAIDLTKAAGAELLVAVIQDADVLISEPGLDGRQPVQTPYLELAVENPRLVYCRLTGHGDDGPLAGSWTNDRLVAARYGVHNQPGWRDGPTFISAPIPSLGAALLAVQGIGAALYQREHTGRGQEVTTSLLAGALAYQPGFASADSGPVLNYPGIVGRGPLGQTALYSIYECADGEWLHFGALSLHFQQRAMDALELRQEMEALGYGTPEANVNMEAIVAVVTARMKTRTFAAWAALFEERDIPYARSQWAEDLFADPQVKAEGLLIEVDDPAVGPMAQMGSTVVCRGQEWRPPTPTPLAGQHTDEVCADLGWAPAVITRLREGGVIA